MDTIADFEDLLRIAKEQTPPEIARVMQDYDDMIRRHYCPHCGGLRGCCVCGNYVITETRITGGD